MATTQIDPADSPSVLADGVIDDALSWLTDELGIGWHLLLPLVLPLVALLVVGLVLTVLLWRRYGRSPSRSTGADVFPGHTATLRSAEGTRGQVFVEGSWWTVRSEHPLHPGQTVRITAVDRLELLVEPLEPHPKEES